MRRERSIQARVLVSALAAVPLLYVALSYVYLACWHGRWWLWNTLIHENGRLTLAGSVFYFDHFLGCAPMAAFFALVLSAGCATGVAGGVPNPGRARRYAVSLLVAAAAFLAASFFASWQLAGWERTVDYLCQRIERDGVLSKGGNWNQLQLSNVPIGLGILGVALLLAPQRGRANPAACAGLGLAATLSATLTALTWPGWEAFANPRWLAHSLRELATYPLTGVPIALAAVVLVEQSLTGSPRLLIRLRAAPLALLAVAAAIVLAELAMLGGADVLALAQRPAFAPNGLGIAYLLASHVFEHFLDFAFFAILAAGLHALLRAPISGPPRGADPHARL